MTLNTFNDNEALWAGELNALANAPGSELIESGCAPSKGTNDWDVDIASGSVRIDGSGSVSVASQTVNLNDPTSDLASGEERIVIVHLNSSGSGSFTEGTAASSNPTTPDIPSGEVLVAVIHVENADATLADSDLRDTRIIVNDGADSGVSADFLRGELPFSDTDDGSDLTVHTRDRGTAGDILNITGSGTMLGGVVAGQADSAAVDITVDGGTTFTVGGGEFIDSNSDTADVTFVPPIKFESSLQVATTDGSAGGSVTVRQ